VVRCKVEASYEPNEPAVSWANVTNEPTIARHIRRLHARRACNLRYLPAIFVRGGEGSQQIQSDHANPPGFSTSTRPVFHALFGARGDTTNRHKSHTGHSLRWHLPRPRSCGIGLEFVPGPTAYRWTRGNGRSRDRTEADDSTGLGRRRPRAAGHSLGTSAEWTNGVANLS
jgi:hypothetical protein